MSLRQRLQDMAEGLCLACLGGLLAGLALSGQYWYFLNPRFRPLTLGSGAALALLGLALLLRPRPGRATAARLARQAVFLGFLSLAAFSWEQAAQAPDPGGFSSGGLAQPLGGAAPEPPAQPEVERAGLRYTRLNLAELYIMVDKGRTDYPERVALRVQAAREPGLARLGLALVTRTAVVCCLADSMELGFLATGLEGLEPGRWVEAYGSLKPLDAAGRAALEAVGQGSGPALKVVNPRYLLAVEAVEPTAPPSFPYLFEFREQPPFAW